jgi:hypothetical protein
VDFVARPDPGINRVLPVVGTGAFGRVEKVKEPKKRDPSRSCSKTAIGDS